MPDAVSNNSIESVPDWVTKTPTVGYELTMWDEYEGDEQQISIEREEFIFLKRQLAVRRGYITPDSEETVESDPELDEAIAKAEAEPSVSCRVFDSDTPTIDPYIGFPRLRARLREYSKTLLAESFAEFESGAQGLDRLLMDLVLEDWADAHSARPSADNLLIRAIRDLLSASEQEEAQHEH